MIDKAIARITDEMMKVNHPFAVFIEEYLTSICTNDRIAEKLLNPQKSLKGFVDKTVAEMRKVAQQGGSGAQSAGLPDVEFHRRAEEYYGITDEDKAGRKKIIKSDVIDITQFL